MIDTHCHINTEQFDKDRDETLRRAFESGVERIIVPAIEPKDYEYLLSFVKNNDKVYCGMGVHPHNSNDFDENAAEIIKKEAKENPKVIAIGEIGLDYYYDFLPKDVQIEAFRNQLKIAKEVDLPVIVHNRESEDDMLKIIDEEQDGSLKGVVHCFSSPLEVMNKVLDLGFNVSFTGNITFKKSNHKDIIENVPKDRFMIETDSPYMAPVPKRGKRNEPAYLKYIAEKIAEIKSIPTNEVIKMTTENAKRLFKIPLMIMFFLSFSLNLFSQEENNQEDVYYEDDFNEDDYNPYKKFIGFGPVLGLNTKVTTYQADEDEVSDDGLTGFGFTFDYSPFDFLILDASYLYTKNNNTVVSLDSIGIATDPSIDHLFEVSSNWVVIPYQRINFYGILGFSALFSSISRLDYTDEQILETTEETNNFGISTGLGMIINIPSESAGLFTVTAEWRLYFMLDENDLDYDPRKYMLAEDPGSDFYQPVSYKVFYSIPRIVLKWYPEFNKK